jgi:predicted RNA-binding Zn-ribbon protein involved in translation (DUF1610 family)
VEDLPLGVMQVDAILSCVDSRTSRRYINQAAWHLGVPFVDGAVDGAGLLVRVNAYVPGVATPCLECSWDAEDYNAAVLDQPYPCQKEGAGPAATNAPAGLGRVVAGLMAIECQKLLAGEFDSLLAGRQMMMDLRHHTHYVTNFNYQPGRCRFDHEIWQVEQLADAPAQLTLGQAIHMATADSASAACALRIEGQRFAALQFCPACGHDEPMAARLAGRLSPAQRRCAACGQAMVVRGFDMREWLDIQSLNEQDLARPLAALGVEPCDVLSVRGPGGERHFLLGRSAASFSAGGRVAARQLSSNTARVGEAHTAELATQGGTTLSLSEGRGSAHATRPSPEAQGRATPSPTYDTN